MKPKTAQSTDEKLSSKPEGGPDKTDAGRNSKPTSKPVDTSKEKAKAMEGNV